VLQCVAGEKLQVFAVSCNVLQCVAAGTEQLFLAAKAAGICSVLPWDVLGFSYNTATHCNTKKSLFCPSPCGTHLFLVESSVSQDTAAAAATHCNTLQHTTTRCNTLQHAATRCTTLQQNQFTLLGTRLFCVECLYRQVPPQQLQLQPQHTATQ